MNWVIAIANVMLVGITSYYAQQARRYVLEMRKDRRARIAPHLVAIYVADENFPSQGRIYVLNVGPGSALEIDVVLSLEPRGMPTRFRCPVIQPAERRVWMPSLDALNPTRQPTPFFPNAQPDRTHVRLLGRCRDTSGRWHRVDEQTPLRDEWLVELNLDLNFGEER